MSFRIWVVAWTLRLRDFLDHPSWLSLHLDEALIGSWQRSQKFIELSLKGELLTGLSMLKHEDHYQGYPSGSALKPDQERVSATCEHSGTDHENTRSYGQPGGGGVR